MMSKDWDAYKGEEAASIDQKWLFLNKEGNGGWFSGADYMELDLENFKRGSDPDNPKKGEVLWKCTYNPKPGFSRSGLEKASSSVFDLNNYLPSWLSGVEMTNPENEAYFERAGWRSGSMYDSNYNFIQKWQMETEAKILPGKRGLGFEGGFKLLVFAMGTAIVDYDKKVHKASSDTETRVTYLKNTAEFVDQVHFQLLRLADDEIVATWYGPGDFSTNALFETQNIDQENVVFRLEVRGGWLSPKPVIFTKEGWDPCLALIIAYLCAQEYSPKEIKRDYDPEFPDEPPGNLF